MNEPWAAVVHLFAEPLIASSRAGDDAGLPAPELAFISAQTVDVVPLDVDDLPAWAAGLFDRYVAEAHGGRVTAEAAEGGGMCLMLAFDTSVPESTSLAR